MKKLASLFVALATLVCCAACMAACAAEPVEVTGVSLDKTELTLEVGGEATLTATVAPENADDKTVTWSSDNAEVVTVEDGKVSALKFGSATVTAKAGEKSATCEVTVVDYKVTEAEWKEAIKLDGKNFTFTVDQDGKMGTETFKQSLTLEMLEDGSMHQSTTDIVYGNEWYYIVNQDKTVSEYYYTSGANGKVCHYVAKAYETVAEYKERVKGDDVGFFGIMLPYYGAYNGDFTYDEVKHCYKGTVDAPTANPMASPDTKVAIEVYFENKKLVKIFASDIAEDYTSTATMSLTKYGTTTITPPTDFVAA